MSKFLFDDSEIEELTVEAEGQTTRQPEGQTDGQTGGQTDGQTGGQTEGHVAGNLGGSEKMARHSGNAVAACRLPEEAVNIGELTEFELKILALMAYLGGGGYGSYSGKYKILGNRHNKTMTEMNDIGEKLCRKGYMTYGWGQKGNFNTYELKPVYLFKLILFVLDRHPEWLVEFKTINEQWGDIKELWTILEQVYTENIQALKLRKSLNKLFWSWDDPKFYIDLLEYEFFAPYAMVISSLKLEQAMDKRYELDFANDGLFGSRLAAYERCVDLALPQKSKEAEIVTSRIYEQNRLCFYRFMLTGELNTEKLTRATAEMLAARAILLLYKRQNEEALRAFEEALALRNKVEREKNVFDNPYLAFYLMLCYMVCSKDPSVRKKASVFVGKKYVKDNLGLRPAAFVVHNLILQDRVAFLKDDIKDMSVPSIYQTNKQFYQLFASYFKEEVDLPIKPKLPLSSCALLRYEQSAFMDVPDKELLRERLQGAPLLAEKEQKAAWEIIFEELVGTDEPVAVVEKEKPQERIVYIGDGEEWLPYRQHVLKSGKWSTPVRVGLKNFLEAVAPTMDEKDKEIAAILRRQNTWWPEQAFQDEYMFPHLVGSDRVFYRRYESEPLLQVEIKEEKPFLQIKRGKNDFVISSNVAIIDKKEIVERQSDTLYLVYRFSDYEFKAFQRLLSLGSIPQKAEEALRGYLAQLNQRLEIHSPLVEGGSTLEQVEGSSRIILRLHPDEDAFVLQELVQPLEGGDMECLPAKGEAVVYVTKDGVRYQVNRNLKREQDSLCDLDEFLLNYGVDAVGTTECIIRLEALLPLLEFANNHQNLFVVEWLEGYKLKVRTYDVATTEQVRLSSRENWLEVEGELHLSENEILTYAELLRLMSEEKVARRFVKLQNGDYLALSEQIAGQLSKLEQVSVFDHKHTRIPLYQIGAIAQIIGNARAETSLIQADKELKDLIKRVEQASKTEFPLPNGLRTELRDYQQEGYQWMMRLAAWGANGCLADDMGLGKTIQAIAFMLQHAGDGPSLVVAPASVVFNWEQELRRFAPALHPHILNEATEREQTITNLQPFDVLLTTYGLIVREEERLTQTKWNVISLDEAHTIKNRATKMSASAMALQGTHRLMLTGTPIQNNLSELWNLFQFLNPGLLGSYEQFNQRFIQPIEKKKQAAAGVIASDYSTVLAASYQSRSG